MQGAADTDSRQLAHLLLNLGEGGIAIADDSIEKGGLSGSEEAGVDGDRELDGCGHAVYSSEETRMREPITSSPASACRR